MKFVTAAVFLLTATLAGAQPSNCYRRIAEDFVPITRTERVAEYVHRLAGPSAFLYIAARAGSEQANDSPREWEQGALGYSRRFGSASAEHIIATTLQHGFALGLHEDTRYFGSGSRNIAERLGYALASPLFTRHGNGRVAPAFSAMAGVGGAALISRAWQPRSTNSLGDAAISFGITMGFRALWNTARELAPRRIGAAFR